MAFFEKTIQKVPQEGVHLRVSKGVAFLLADADFEDVNLYFEVVCGVRTKVKTTLDILALGIGGKNNLKFILESQKKSEDDLVDLAEEVAFTLTHVTGIAV